MTDNMLSYKARLYSRRVEEVKYTSANVTPYEVAKAKNLEHLDKAWRSLQEGKPQTWFPKGKLDESLCYVTPRYGRRLLGEAIPVPRSELKEAYLDLRSAIEADEFKEDILTAQRSISKSHRDKAAAKAAKKEATKEAA